MNKLVIINATQKFPKNPQKFLKDWVVKAKATSTLPADYLNQMHILANDHRMHDFWRWVSDERSKWQTQLFHEFAVCGAIIGASEIPAKPGNMTPKKRDAYLKKVRKYATELKHLLSDTKFDRSGATFFYEDTEIDVLYELSDVIDWTELEDKWDLALHKSSAPIIQANAATVRQNHFVCMVYDWLAARHVIIPFSVLATLANAALQLSAEEQTDEDRVRKQVTRNINRKLKRDS